MLDHDDIHLAQFDRLLYAWLAEIEKRGLGGSTRGKYRETLRAFYSWCHSQDEPIMLGDVRRDQVIAWRDDMASRYSVSTANQRMTAIRSFYDFLLDRDLISRNPAHRLPGVSRKGEQRKKRGELTDQQMRQLLTPWSRAEAAIRDLAIIHLMAYCALRSAEIARLNFEDLAARDGRLLLWVWGKGRAEPDQSVTLPAPAEEALRDWITNRPGERGGPLFVSLSARGPGRRLTVGYIRAMVKRRLRRAGAGDRSPEAIRAAAIKNAIRQGANPLKVRRMARHQKLETTLSYWKDQPDQPVEDLIDYSDPEPD